MQKIEHFNSRYFLKNNYRLSHYLSTILICESLVWALSQLNSPNTLQNMTLPYAWISPCHFKLLYILIYPSSECKKEEEPEVALVL